MDYGELEAFLQEEEETAKIRFSELVGFVVSGDWEGLKQEGLRLVKNSFSGYEYSRTILAELLVLSIASAFFYYFGKIFHDRQVADTAWFAVYLTMLVLLLRVFSGSMSMTRTFLNRLLRFMEVLLPTFSIALTAISGAAASGIFYHISFLLVTFVQGILLYLVLPVIELYVILSLLNGMTEESTLSGMTEVLELFLSWLLKTTGAVTIGLQVIQSIIIPSAASGRSAVLQKLIASIPGVGGGLRTVTQAVLGSGVLIKNGIGLAALIVISVLVLLPASKLALGCILYYFCAAIVQPAAGKKTAECIRCVAYGIRLLLKVLFLSAFLFLITLAVLCACTNQIYV